MHLMLDISFVKFYENRKTFNFLKIFISIINASIMNKNYKILKTKRFKNVC